MNEYRVIDRLNVIFFEISGGSCFGLKHCIFMKRTLLFV